MLTQFIITALNMTQAWVEMFVSIAIERKSKEIANPVVV